MEANPPGFQNAAITSPETAVNVSPIPAALVPPPKDRNCAAVRPVPAYEPVEPNMKTKRIPNINVRFISHYLLSDGSK
jgi:hypothetical protein